MRYSGNILRAALPGNTSANASGNWELEDAVQQIGQNQWPLTITQGDPYFYTNVLLLNGDNTNGANNSLFVDSAYGLTVNRNGNATQGSFTPFGGLNYSVYFDGSGDYLSAPDIPARELGSNSFTIECWAYFTSSSACTIISHRTATTTLGTVLIAKNASNQITFSAATATTSWNIFNAVSIGTVSLNQWVHISICRSGNNFYGSINGIVVSIGTTASVIGDSTAPWYIGGDSNGLTMTGNLSNVRMVMGSALYTSTFSPSTLPLAPITGTVLLTCNSAWFQDFSPISSTITPAGNASVYETSPFDPTTYTPTSYSAVFDGAGDYLSVASTPSLATTTTPFTIECWVYPVAQLSGTAIVSQDFAGSGTIPFCIFGATDISTNTSGSNLCAGYYNGSSWTGISSTTSLTLYTWSHIALVFNGTVATLYLNGTSIGTSTSSWITGGNSPFYIGRRWDTTATPYFNGTISNFRFVIGSAIYTSNFTPPTTPLTAVSGTALLTCQNANLTDASGNSLAITSFGEARPITTSPFGQTIAFGYGYSLPGSGASMYCDGTGDFVDMAWNSLYTLGASDFTFECWAYPLTTSAVIGFMSNWQAGGQFQFTRTATNRLQFATQSQGSVTGTTTLINPYCWNHVVATRRNGVGYLFVNGVRDATTWAIGTTSITGAGKIMRYGAAGDATSPITGYLTGCKIVIGSGNTYVNSFVPPVSPATASDAPVVLLNMANAGISDFATGTIFETFGNAQVDTNVKKFGTGSIALDGTGDYLSARASPLWQLAGDFTVECWINYTNHGSTGGIVGSANSSLASAISAGWFLDFSGTTDNLQFEAQGGVALVSTNAVPRNEWVHIAAVRYNGTITLYINGVPNGSVFNASNYWSSGSPLLVGVDRSQGVTMTGWIDDLRISRMARYTASFVPANGPFPTY